MGENRGESRSGVVLERSAVIAPSLGGVNSSRGPDGSASGAADYRRLSCSVLGRYCRPRNTEAGAPGDGSDAKSQSRSLQRTPDSPEGSSPLWSTGYGQDLSREG